MADLNTVETSATATVAKATTFVEKQAAWVVAHPKLAVAVVLAYTAACAVVGHIL
jgi:hypothetical protein